VITGNAGDGKTAFLKKLEGLAEEKGATFDALGAQRLPLFR